MSSLTEVNKVSSLNCEKMRRDATGGRGAQGSRLHEDWRGRRPTPRAATTRRRLAMESGDGNVQGAAGLACEEIDAIAAHDSPHNERVGERRGGSRGQAP